MKNSLDMNERMKHTNCRGNKMASFDMKALFTNTLVKDALDSASRVINDIDDGNYPYVKMIT